MDVDTVTDIGGGVLVAIESFEGIFHQTEIDVSRVLCSTGNCVRYPAIRCF